MFKCCTSLLLTLLKAMSWLPTRVYAEEDSFAIEFSAEAAEQTTVFALHPVSGLPLWPAYILK